MTRTLSLPVLAHPSRLHAPAVPPEKKEKCAVFGVWGHPHAARISYLGLYALQHRGQESVGIATSDGARLQIHKGIGYVADNFSEETFARLSGTSAIGHVRYSTAGESGIKNAQPILIDCAHGEIAIGHNGNIVNAQDLRDVLVSQGSIFQTTSDTEVILHLMARNPRGELVESLMRALAEVEGAFSLLLIGESAVVAARDPNGIRPLWMGELDGKKCFASETCAFDLLGAKPLRELDHGEVVVVRDGEATSFRLERKGSPRRCIFEHVYFARPDSNVFSRSVMASRREMGRLLAKRHPVAADLVVPVPDSGVSAALGYAEASGIPFDFGMIRNHYVGRTFIEPTQQIRALGVKLKHNANRAHIEGKRVILVDDSIVRGTTSMKIVEMVRGAGAREVHMRIAAPPTSDPCFYGIDTPERDKLLASRYDVAGMAKFIGVDSLAFLSIDGLYRAMGLPGRDPANPTFCDACFTGDYPIALDDVLGVEDRQLSLLVESA